MTVICKQRSTSERPSAFIFDWDNTLVESHEAVTYAINEVFTAYNKPKVTLFGCKTSPQKSLKDSFPSLFGEDWQVARDLYHTHYEKVHTETLKPKENAEDLLAYLYSLEIPLFILSNKGQAHLDAEIAFLGWDKYFHHIRGSKDGHIDKPDPIAVHEALRESGFHPEKEPIWFVGDSLVDAECALQSGCIPILIPEPGNKNIFQPFENKAIFAENLLRVKKILDSCQ